MNAKESFSRRYFLYGTAVSTCALASCPFLDGWSQDPIPLGDAPPAKPTRGTDGTFIREARHYSKLENDRIRCTLCNQECTVSDGFRGKCGVRENRKGAYHTLVYGRACTCHVDPIEKKPLFHFHPGSKAFSIATAGCNLTCKFCQNWNISQMKPEDIPSFHLPPEDVVQGCKQEKAECLAFTYNEATVFYEYMYDCAAAAKAAGIHPVLISNGFMQQKPLEELSKQLSAIKIDLKAFTEKFYLDICGARLKPVLENLKLIKQLGLWCEIVTLIIPTLNDGEDELKSLCGWITSELGPSLPLHFSRFHPTYKLQNLPPTPAATLETAYRIAKEQGLQYVYIGNLPGNHTESTCCPKCGEVLIRRYANTCLNNNIKDGKCSKCAETIPGVWG